MWDYKCGMGGYEHGIGIHACGGIPQAWTYGSLSTLVYGVGSSRLLIHMHGYVKPIQDRSKLVSYITQASRHSKRETKILFGQHL